MNYSSFSYLEIETWHDVVVYDWNLNTNKDAAWFELFTLVSETSLDSWASPWTVALAQMGSHCSSCSHTGLTPLTLWGSLIQWVFLQLIRCPEATTTLVLEVSPNQEGSLQSIDFRPKVDLLTKLIRQISRGLIYWESCNFPARYVLPSCLYYN